MGTRGLRLLGWAVLAAGVAGAGWLWATARHAVEVTRRVVGHATLTFRDVEVDVSVERIAAGAASLLLGVFLFALGRVVADLADEVRGGSERGCGRGTL
ncbi:MAG TPA: hypothetical protein VHL78_10245 [Actinomycetota bacterium]|nr:hypothetical protein [Actinomycetota bacterium]